MWIAELTAAVLAAIGALWLFKKAWLLKHPEKEITNLENRLLKNLREGNPTNVMLTDWNVLCNKVKKGMAEPNPVLAHRGAEVIKLFVGEYFRGDLSNVKLNAAIYRQLAVLYAASIAQHPELATEIVIALRVAAREIMERNKGVFDDVIRQFTLYGLLALREKQYYFTARILDQIFILMPKSFNKGLTVQQQSVLRAISTLGQAVIKRQDNGLAREIVSRLRQSQDAAGQPIHEPIYDMLLKSVRVGSMETLDLLMETSKSLMSENETEVKKTLRIWAEAAKNAVMKQDEASVRKIIEYMVKVTEERLLDDPIATYCLDELFAVIILAIRGKTVAEYAEFLLPVLELGCLCMQRELTYGFTDGAMKSYQGPLKRLLDKLLHLGAVVTRDGRTNTGAWVADLYCRWSQIPDNAYRKEILLKFVQLWLLYWINCQRKTAKSQGGLPDVLFKKNGWLQMELERFPNLYIRSVQ